ncbi:SETMR methyltransferase, partial [Acromyrmex insinuator]
KTEFRTVIKHLHMKGLTPKEIKAEDNVHTTSASAFTTVYNWVNEFKHGRTSTCDAPHSGRPSKQWTSPSEPAPKKAKTVKSAGKVIATDYYAALLDRFNNILKKNAKKKVLFHQDNARVHTYPAPIAKFNEFRYELLLHLAYSPDLTPCDYFRFPNLKKWFGGKRFTTREQLIVETEAYFEESDKSYYSDGLKKLKNRWIKCIELKGNYVEK